MKNQKGTATLAMISSIMIGVGVDSIMVGIGVFLAIASIQINLTGEVK